MRKIDKIVVHCSDSDHDYHDNVESIRKWHVDERGWSDIGYHYIITKDGCVHKGRDAQITGAHCSVVNKGSLGICLTGKKKFSKEQKESLKMLVRELNFIHDLQNEHVFPHNFFDTGKTCPNFDIYEVIS